MTEHSKLEQAMQEVDKGLGAIGAPRPRLFQPVAHNPENVLTYLQKMTASQVEVLRELERIRKFLGLD